MSAIVSPLAQDTKVMQKACLEFTETAAPLLPQRVNI